MVTPKTSKCMGKPQSSTLGLRVRRTTMRTGTKKMRSNVSAFGRFIRAYGVKKAALCGQKRTAPHYRLGVGRRQRVEERRRNERGGYLVINTRQLSYIRERRLSL